MLPQLGVYPNQFNSTILEITGVEMSLHNLFRCRSLLFKRSFSDRANSEKTVGWIVTGVSKFNNLN